MENKELQHVAIIGTVAVKNYMVNTALRKVAGM
jgi:hypothetical protein